MRSALLVELPKVWQILQSPSAPVQGLKPVQALKHAWKEAPMNSKPASTQHRNAPQIPLTFAGFLAVSCYSETKHLITPLACV